MTSFNLERIGAGLAFTDALAHLQDALEDGTCLVQAPPGTGKTTLVPPAVHNHLGAGAHAQSGRVLVTGPRRVSVRAAATRLAALTGTRLGERIGYTIRGERSLTETAQIEFLTPGVLLRRLLSQPDLPGVSAVILDEVHERSLEVDLLLAMLADLRQIREHLVLVAMSATLDSERIAGVLGPDTPVVTARGRQHPVHVEYAPFDGVRFTERGAERGFLTHVAGVTLDALARSEGDVLVFLPGQAEINRVADAVRAGAPTIEVLPLYSARPAAEQQRVLGGRGPNDPRRVIVSSAVAESSVTVPGVRTVVDAGLARESRRDTRRGMTGLVTVTASRASAEQRAGRAGREGPGRAIRCLAEATLAAAPAAPRPEIFTADLTSAALDLACWGTPGGEGLTMLDPLPQAAYAEATAELVALGAVDDSLRVTPLGTRLARMPLDPALAAALLRGSDLLGEAGSTPAAEIVALLATDLRVEGADLPGALAQLITGRHPHTRAWRAETRRLRQILQRVDPGPPPAADRAGRTTAAKVRALARPDLVGYLAVLGGARVARLDGGSYLLESGTRATLPPASPLTGAEWIAVVDVARSTSRRTADTGAIIYAAAPVPEHLLDDLVPIRDSRQVRLRNGRITARALTHRGAIPISSTPVAPTQADIRAGLEELLRDRGPGALRWSTSATQLRRRIGLAHTVLGPPWPDVGDDALSRHPSWLTDHATSAAIAEAPVAAALRALVPWPQAGQLDHLAPTHLGVPSGRQVPLTYPEPGQDQVLVSVKLQECFGMARSPRILDGRIPVVLELLSPAGRPLALTGDLEFFWREVYPQVRAENRARYAKHPWPHDPWEHEATARTSAQLRRQRS